MSYSITVLRLERAKIKEQIEVLYKEIDSSTNDDIKKLAESQLSNANDNLIDLEQTIHRLLN